MRRGALDIRFSGRHWWWLTFGSVLAGCTILAACGDGSGNGGPVSPPAPTGALRLISTTDGRNLDPNGYSVMVGSGPSQSMGLNDTVTVSGLTPGVHSVTLSGFSANCYPFEAMPIDLVVTADVTRDVPLGVECLGMPDDITLTFVRNRLSPPWGFNLAGIRSGTGEVEPLTFNPVLDRAPDWSPDGTRLAWSRDNVIHIVNLDGTGLRSFGDRGQGSNPEWSPDGSLIAYDNGSQVLVFNPDGTGETVVGTGIQPAWSPDGTKLAVEIEGATAFEGDIVVMNADGSGAVNITAFPVMLDREPAWSPDGTRIAFRRLNRLESTGYDLWVIDADGGNPVKILELAGPQLEPLWLPDNRILFAHDRSIWAIDPDGGGAPVKLTEEPGFSHFGVTIRQ